MNMTPKQLTVAGNYSLYPQPAGLFVSLKTDAHKTFKTKFDAGTCFRSRRKLKSAWEFFRATATGVESISQRAFLEFIDSATPPAAGVIPGIVDEAQAVVEVAAAQGNKIAEAALKSAEPKKKATPKSKALPKSKTEKAAAAPAPVVEAPAAKSKSKSKKPLKKDDVKVTEVVVSKYTTSVVLGQTLNTADTSKVKALIGNGGMRVTAPNSLTGVIVSLVREGDRIVGLAAGRPRDSGYIETINSRTRVTPALPNDALELCWLRTEHVSGADKLEVERLAGLSVRDRAVTDNKKLFAVYNVSNTAGIEAMERLGATKYSRTHSGMSKEAQLLTF